MILEFGFSNFGPVNDKVTLSFEATKDDTLEEHYVVQQKDGTRVLKLGIIYGPNASGKTTILDALQMLRDLVKNPLEQKKDEIKYPKHKLNNAFEKDTSFSIKFYVNNIKYDYEIVFNNEFIREEKLNYYPNNREALFFERNYDGKVSEIKFGSTLDEVNNKVVRRLEANTIKNVSVFGAYSKTNVSIDYINQINNWFDKCLLPIISPEDTSNLFTWTSGILNRGKISKKKVIEFLAKADLNISDLNIIENELDLDDEILNQIDSMSIPDEAKEQIKERKKITSVEVEFYHEFKGSGNTKSSMSLPKELESSGTRRYYQLIGPLLMALQNDSFLFIDELESSLHPDLIKSFIANFLENSNKAQLLFTTHNISLLSERDILRNDTIWFTEKNEYGATDLYSLADFKSDQIRKNSSILNAYNFGKLGAKPKTSIVNLKNG